MTFTTRGSWDTRTSDWRGPSWGLSPGGGLHTVRLNVRMSAIDKLLSRRPPSSLGKCTATIYHKVRSTLELSHSASPSPA